MADGAVRAVAADDERRPHLPTFAVRVERHRHDVVVLDRGHERGGVLDSSAPLLELLDQQSLGDVLRHHRDQRIGAFARRERHSCKGPSVRDDGNRRHLVGRGHERPHQAGHIEDLERSRKDGQGLRVFRLRRSCLDEAPAESAPLAFVGQE